MTAPWRYLTVVIVIAIYNHAEYLLFIRSMIKWRMFLKTFWVENQTRSVLSSVSCAGSKLATRSSCTWKCPFISLKIALTWAEHVFYPSGAYLCKSKTAENELESDAPKVRFDTFQALSQYFCVTLVHHFVTVLAVVKTNEYLVNQWLTVSVVTTMVDFQKVVLKSWG